MLLMPASLFALGDKDYDPTTLVFPSFLHTMGIRKATKMHLMIYTRNRVKVRNPQGIAVVRLTSWDDPNKKKDDDEVTGYGVNAGENIIVYNKSMTSLGFYGKNETGIKKLNHPTGITANARGDVYVADTGNHRIVRLFNPKQALNFVRAIGGRGALPGQFMAPQGIAMDSHDMVYVSDTGNQRIQVLRPDDQLHLWFGDQGVEDGQLWHPAGIAVTNGKERWSHFKDAFIVVVDLDGKRLQKFTLDGMFVRGVRLSDLKLDEGRFAYLALDYYSNVWVTDTVNHCIHKFDRELNYLTTFGRKGHGDKEFDEPRGMAIYKRFGQVFVAEKESAQYYWIGTDILDFEAKQDTVARWVELSFFLTEPSYLTLTVRDEKNKGEITVFKRAKFFTGQQSVLLGGNWQRMSSSGTQPHDGSGPDLEPMKSGRYRLELKVEPTYSSINYFAKNVETSLAIP
ncbi:MAG: NHL repeat-containing protein [bacterium]